jgi:hypothetical protein
MRNGANVGQAVQSVAVPPVHVLQPLLHGWHTLDESAYVPDGHDATQVVEWRYGVDEEHVVQSVLLPPEHVAQSAWQLSQPPVTGSYMPVGHSETQSVPCRIGAVEVEEHDVQLVEVPKHVWHVELHEWHTPRLPVVMTYCPTAHADEHVPAAESKLPPGMHEVQPVDVASVQEAHEASHATHVLLASANLPRGQLATQ